MTHEEIDAIWQQAMRESIKDGEVYIRYHFAKLVAVKAFQNGYEKGVAAFNDAVLLEREACAKVCDEYSAIGKIEEFDRGWLACAKNTAAAIRARGQA